MQLHKFRADKLFDGYQMRGDDTVLVMSGDGTVVDLLPITDAGDGVVHYTGILSPGFINCHGHLELAHMRNSIPERTGLVSFVSHIIKNRHVGQDEIAHAINMAEEEMIRNGIVAAGDICNNSLTLPQKLKGRIRYHNFIEASGFPPEVAESRFQRAVDIYHEYAKHHDQPTLSSSIVPHAPYSVSDQLWEKIIRFPGNSLLSIHNQETPGEDDLFVSKKGELLDLYTMLGIDINFFQATGKSSIQSYITKFIKGQQVILVHNVHITEEDLLSIKAQSNRENFIVYYCLCPNANLYISGLLPDMNILQKESPNIVLGTDSIASNWQLSILSEMQTLRKHFPSISLEDLFRWATSNGAKALQMDNILGSFERGKKPGLILSDSDLAIAQRLL